MYLVDTNLILEVLLRQAKAEEVKQFFERAPSQQLFLSEFSLYSLGVLLIRRNMHDIFLRSIEDLLFIGGVTLLRLAPADLADVARRSQQFGLDFDDAYHPQTILAYEMNGRALPIAHGAPIRLRVERQLGYKHAKYVMRIELVEHFADIAGGRGGYWEDQGYEWYAGI